MMLMMLASVMSLIGPPFLPQGSQMVSIWVRNGQRWTCVVHLGLENLPRAHGVGWLVGGHAIAKVSWPCCLAEGEGHLRTWISNHLGSQFGVGWWVGRQSQKCPGNAVKLARYAIYVFGAAVIEQHVLQTGPPTCPASRHEQRLPWAAKGPAISLNCSV